MALRLDVLPAGRRLAARGAAGAAVVHGADEAVAAVSWLVAVLVGVRAVAPAVAPAAGVAVVRPLPVGARRMGRVLPPRSRPSP